MATSHTETTILDRLLDDHAEIRRAITAVEDAPRRHRARHVQHLRRVLVRHETVERVLVHPATASVGGAVGIAVAVEEEERASERTLARVQDLDPADPAFDRAFSLLRDQVLAHAEHEERDEFPRLRAELDHDTQVRLADAARALELIAPTRPHPRVPADPASQLALGPALGLLDRIRDLAARRRRRT